MRSGVALNVQQVGQVRLVRSQIHNLIELRLIIGLAERSIRRQVTDQEAEYQTPKNRLQSDRRSTRCGANRRCRVRHDSLHS